jgi:hypothetical protein
MDDRSAARYAAYKHGRGAEYDDKTKAHEEAQKKRGEPPPKPAAASHQHSHAHSPLEKAVASARKRRAAGSAGKAEKA